MPISMECPSCMNSFSLPDEMAGRKSKCPECQFAVFVPRGETTGDPTTAVAPAPSAPPSPKAAPKRKAVDVAAVTPIPQKKSRAVKKATAATASDNPFDFSDTESAGSRRRKSGGNGGILLLAGLAVFVLGGLLLLGAGGGAVWLFWSRAKAQEAALAEANARAAEELKHNLEPSAETKKPDDKEAPPKKELPKEEPKNEKPKKPDGKPVHDPIGKPPEDMGKTKPNQDPKEKPLPAKQPRLTLAPITAQTVKAGDKIMISVSVVREDCKGTVTISAVTRTASLRADVVILEEDFDRGTMQVSVDPNVMPGKYPISVLANLNAKDPLVAGQMFDLTVEKPAAPVVNQPPPADAAKGPLQLLGGIRIAVEIRVGTIHKGAVECVALSPDGKWGLSGGVDGTVHLWDMDKGPVAAIHKDGPALSAVAISPDGKWAASGDVKGGVRLYNLEKKMSQVLQAPKAQPGMPNPDNRVNALEFSPKSELLVVGNQTNLTIWKVATGDQTIGVLLADSPCFHFTADGGNVYAINGKSIAVVDPRRVALPSSLGGDKTKEFSATYFDCYHARRELIAIVPKDKQAELQRISEKTGQAQTLVTFTEMGELPLRVVVADKSGYALTSDRDGKIRGWELDTGKEVFTLTGHKGEVHGLAVTPDGRRAFSGGADGTNRIFDLRNEKPN